MRPSLAFFGPPKIQGGRLVLRSLSRGSNAYLDGGLHGVPQAPRRRPASALGS